MCESFSKTSLVAIASTAIDYIGVSTDYSCCAVEYAALIVAPIGVGYDARQNICELYRRFANANLNECGFIHIPDWYKLSEKEKLAYRTEMLYYFLHGARINGWCCVKLQ